MIKIFSRDRDVKIAYLATAKFCQLSHSFSLFLRDVTGIAERLSPHKKLNRVGVIFVLFILMQGEPRVVISLRCLQGLASCSFPEIVSAILEYIPPSTVNLYERKRHIIAERHHIDKRSG